MEVDHHANVYCIEAQEAQLQPCQSFAGKPWSIWIDDQNLCQDVKSQIYEAVHATNTKKYWTRRKGPRMSSNAYDSIGSSD